MQIYKVVKTIENGEEYITSVPHSWENEGKLKWPPVSNSLSLDKYRKKCVPPEENWATMACTVLYSDVQSFVYALELEKRRADFTNSESEEAVLSSKRRKRSAPFTDRIQNESTNYNILFENALVNSGCDPVLTDATSSKQNTSTTLSTLSQNQSSSRTSSTTSMNSLCDDELSSVEENEMDNTIVNQLDSTIINPLDNSIRNQQDTVTVLNASVINTINSSFVKEIHNDSTRYEYVDFNNYVVSTLSSKSEYYVSIKES